ncbi:MAG: efflux RND transporter periplasmic adaptor subunit [Acidobacteriota bacterium]
MKKRMWIGIAVLVVIAAVVVTIVVRGKNRNVTQVTTTKVVQADLVSKVSANGAIQAQRKVDLSANVMGQIVNLAVREGDEVRKGDFLMQIDRAQLAASAAGAQASLNALFSDREAARANLDESRRNLQRAEKNYSEKIIPLAEVQQARTAVQAAEANIGAISNRIEQARAGLAGARDTLSKTTIRAPMDGLITRLPVEAGEVAVIGTMNNAGTVLLTISDMSVVEAVMQVDETDIPNVKVGQKAHVTIDAYPGQTYEGLVTEVASSPKNAVTAGTSTEAINFEVKVQLLHPPAGVRPGFSSSADIVTGHEPSAVAVPIQALVVREKPVKGPAAPNAKAVDEEGVYLFDPATKKVSFQIVKTGLTGDTLVGVTEGLKVGQEIVTGPFRALRDIKDGDTVKIAVEGKGDKGGKDKDSKS